MILQIFSNRQILYNINSMFVQFICWTDSRKHQHLRRVDRSRTKYNLFFSYGYTLSPFFNISDTVGCFTFKQYFSYIRIYAYEKIWTLSSWVYKRMVGTGTYISIQKELQPAYSVLVFSVVVFLLLAQVEVTIDQSLSLKIATLKYMHVWGHSILNIFSFYFKNLKIK